jgi:hypothetical protein
MISEDDILARHITRVVAQYATSSTRFRPETVEKSATEIWQGFWTPGNPFGPQRAFLPVGRFFLSGTSESLARELFVITFERLIGCLPRFHERIRAFESKISLNVS